MRRTIDSNKFGGDTRLDRGLSTPRTSHTPTRNPCPRLPPSLLVWLAPTDRGFSFPARPFLVRQIPVPTTPKMSRKPLRYPTEFVGVYGARPRLHIFPGTRSRCVDDGFTLSRPDAPLP